MLFLKLLKVELFYDSLYLLIKFIIELLVLKGSLIKLLIQTTLLYSTVGHIVQLC